MAVSEQTIGLVWTITDHGGENRVYGLTEDGKRVVGFNMETRATALGMSDPVKWNP